MSPAYHPVLLRLLGLKENGHIDRDYVSVLVGQLRESSIERAVLVGQDGRYDEDGILDREATHVYVPNDYLLKVAREHSDLFVPCISINPRRRDAFEELERLCRGGRPSAEDSSTHPGCGSRIGPVSALLQAAGGAGHSFDRHSPYQLRIRFPLTSL